jgi:uncharacterized RDD family membrane protein YckC
VPTTVSVSSFRRAAPAYAPADGAYWAVAAPGWRRVVAAALDWGLVFVLFLLVGFPLGMIQTLAKTVGGTVNDAVYALTEAVGLGVVVVYFAWFFGTGHTLGMRALDIHIFSHGSGREPHPVRAAARGLLSLGFFLATIDAYGLSSGAYRQGGLTDAQTMWRQAAVAGAALALGGALWKLVDPDGRTLWDRLFGLVVVEDVVPASMPDRLWSPWGT